MVKKNEYATWGIHKEVNKRVSWSTLPPSIQNYIVKNMLENEQLSFNLKSAFRRTFGLSIVQLEVGEQVFNLEETVARFDGDMNSTDFDEISDQPETVVNSETLDDIPRYTKEYMERNDLILKQRFLL